MNGELEYGPVGNPDSTDPFEWAQARMPEGWHVEGQRLGAYFASRKGGTAFTWGRTPAALVARVESGEEQYETWWECRAAASR
jgi:hypothetical protein